MKGICAVLVIFSHLAMSKTVARVSSLEGKAFSIDKAGKLRELKFTDEISASKKILVDDFSHLELKTEDGSYYYLLGGTQVSLFTDGLKLTEGKVWAQIAPGSKHRLLLTSNAKARHGTGNFVYSFNSYEGKTQVLTITGQSVATNILDENLKIPVKSGEFTLIHKDFNSGYPRPATLVGKDSYEKIKLSFHSFPKLKSINLYEQVSVNPGREIASVKPGKPIRFVSHQFTNKKKQGRVPASVKTTKSAKKKKSRGKSISVKVFKTPSVTDYQVMPELFENEKKLRTRLPASFRPRYKSPKRQKVKEDAQLESLIKKIKNT